ncbi:MAG: hypothetical protein MUP17_04980 [candidate division Zixibacteria bacterium]|nr:hypothetical protein [candidate division Zixibacteria bacterium]
MEMKGGYPILFIVTFIIVAFVFIVLFPMVLTFNTALWLNGEGIRANGLAAANGIKDTAVRNSVTGIFTTSTTSFIDSQTIIGYAAQYGIFIVMIVVVTLIILLARRQVETGLV